MLYIASVALLSTPTFKSANQLTLFQNTTIGTQIYDVRAVDIDSENAGRVSYGIIEVSGTPQSQWGKDAVPRIYNES